MHDAPVHAARSRAYTDSSTAPSARHFRRSFCAELLEENAVVVIEVQLGDVHAQYNCIARVC